MATGGLTINEAEPFAGLKALSQRQRQSPDTRAQAIAPPPGIDASEVAPLGDVGPDSPASAPLDTVLAKFQPEATAAPAAAQSANAQALHLYVTGRAKLVDGQPGKAVTDLEAATRLDPSVPEPWRELGEAQMQLGRRTSAMASYQKAIKLGLDEPRLLDLLARDSIKTKKYDEAVKLLIQARQSKSLGEESGLAPLVDIDLAEALGALGYLSASRDLLAKGLSAPFEGIGQSRMRSELTEVLRRRGELWQRVGDISCRLGQYDKAAEAYSNAAQVPTLDPGAVISRRVLANLRLGHSADAALVVIEDIRQSEGRVEDRHMGVIRYLAQNTDVGPKLAEAISDISRMAGPNATPTVMNRLARASAAALTGEQARGVLRARLAKSPSDADLVMDLLATRNADDVKGAIAECTKLIQAAPLAADTYAQMLIVRGQAIDATVQALAHDRAPAARLLDASLLTKLARPEQALAQLEGVDWPPEMLPAALLQRAKAAVANGDWAKASAADEKLAALQGQDADRARAKALQSMQQFDAAFETMAPVISDSANASVDDLLLAGELALNSNKAAKAEALFTAAIARDRFDERAHEALLSLYSPSGPLADETKLTSAARALRQSIATSRAIRGISAQDLVARSLWSQAQGQLLSMITEGNENPETLNLLVTVWERAAPSEPDLTSGGERWLRARLAERPESSALLIALARVLVAEDKASEADSLLTARLTASQLPDIARAREWVVRKGLDKPDEADQMARLRLEQSPKTIDNTIELSELLVKSGDVDEAAQRLTSGLPEHARLTGEQASRLVAILPKLKPESIARKDPASLDVAIRLFDLIAGRGTMTPQMYITRLTLLATGHPSETDRLIAAIDDTTQRHPELIGQAYQAVLEVLTKLDKPGPLLAFLGGAANHISPPNEQLYTTWFIETCRRGGADDIERLVNSPTDNDRCGALLRGIPGRGDGEADIPDTLTERRADIARYAGDYLTNFGKDDLAEKAYRLALKVKPDHPWAANNLGYQILDAGGDFDEASRLIEMAYKQVGGIDDPTPIIDSMGWLLYKRNKLTDEKDEMGAVTKEGAVSVLNHALENTMEKATALGNQPDATILDHAADALWRTGDKDKAKELWLRSESSLKTELETLRRAQVPDTVSKKVQNQLQSVQSKRASAEKNQEPAVAPFAGKKDAPKPISARPGEKTPKPQDAAVVPERP
jgi:tetratricopeptide (TPR) repeat protein